MPLWTSTRWCCLRYWRNVHLSSDTFPAWILFPFFLLLHCVLCICPSCSLYCHCSQSNTYCSLYTVHLSLFSVYCHCSLCICHSCSLCIMHLPLFTVYCPCSLFIALVRCLLPLFTVYCVFAIEMTWDLCALFLNHSGWYKCACYWSDPLPEARIHCCTPDWWFRMQYSWIHITWNCCCYWKVRLELNTDCESGIILSCKCAASTVVQSKQQHCIANI